MEQILIGKRSNKKEASRKKNQTFKGSLMDLCIPSGTIEGIGKKMLVAEGNSISADDHDIGIH